MDAVVVFDLGTTGNRVIAFSKTGEMLAKSYYEFPQYFPKSGWVEQDPLEIWNTALQAFTDVIGKVGAQNIECIGITNQRETAVMWDRQTGKPLYNAIVWQCRRTGELCEKLNPKADLIRSKTGLTVDPYFSGTKIQWILDNVPGVRERAQKGELLFGTIDTWILWNLTGGKVHATEPSNASRTMCFNIQQLTWDKELLELLTIPEQILPEVKQSGDLFGHTSQEVAGCEIPITGILGDQQASLFGQGGWDNRVVKNTYGTGLFLMGSTNTPNTAGTGLITTVAWKINHEITYAFEGSVFIGGACVQWLRDGLKIIKSAEETEELAASLESNEDVYFVPALAGLGAPHWDPNARGTVLGITRGTDSRHLCRAALEAIAYQTRDVIEVFAGQNPEREISCLRVDGGAAANDFLMQFQADILGFEVERPVNLESTALGAAGMAGIAHGFWTHAEFFSARKVDRIFKPSMDEARRNGLYKKWLEAVERAKGWV
jgi:glycerol kinase